MPLAVLNNALLLHGGGLAGDCSCCRDCPPDPCVDDGDCAGSSIDCVCEDATCIPACVPGSCPVGFICVNGHCVEDSCNSSPCISTSDCTTGCVCNDGICVTDSDQYYCCEDSNGDTNCQRGPCHPTDETTLGGPFNDMALCCASGCDCNYDCNPVSLTCIPNPQGQYPDETTCLQNCTEPGELGICCETLRPESNSNPTLCIIQQPINNGFCVTTRAGCQSDRLNGISRFWQRGFDNCDLCPTSPTGACCKPDGCCEVLCQGDCEDLGGTYMGNSWQDCDTMREPPTIGTACDNYEGCRDCSFEAPDNLAGNFENHIFKTSFFTNYLATTIHDFNHEDWIKDSFNTCTEGRKLILFSITKETNHQLKLGAFFPTNTTRYQRRVYVLGCKDGDVVDLTADALKVADVYKESSYGGIALNVLIGDTSYIQYTHTRSNGEHANDGISAHNVIDPNAGDTIFSDNNTTAPAQHSAIPNIEDQDYWDCP